MNESKQITIENWQFSSVDSIQEFYLFIFDYYHVFWRGGGVTLTLYPQSGTLETSV